jgi:hypothetical protein
MNQVRISLLIGLSLVALGGCGSKQPEAPPKYAVLRFENLTPDKKLDWAGRAMSEVLTKSVSAIPLPAIYQAQQPSIHRPAAAPGISTEISGARLAGATRLISGYYEEVQGKLLFTAMVEDTGTRKTIKSVSVAGNVLPAAAAIAKELTGAAKPYSTQNEAALQAVTKARESSAPDEEMYRKAVALDPTYEEGYAGWAEMALARKDRATLDEIVRQARAHNLSSVSLARLELAAASLSADPADRQKALSKLAAADPADKTILRAVADSEFAARNFTGAADHYAQVADAAHADALNLLAYSRMFGGQEKEAIEASKEYQKLRPEDPNAIDTQGDIEYYFRRYADAEKSYLRAEVKDPKFNGGAEPWKAARARLITGDVSGATQLFHRYFADRTAAKDPTVAYRDAEWKYLTANRAAGISQMLGAAKAAANPALKTAALAQAAIWELQTGKREDAERDAGLVMSAGQNPSLLQAIIIRFSAAGAPASAEEWRKRGEAVFHGEGEAQVRALVVAYALLISGHYADAVPLWKGLYLSANPNDQSIAFLYAGALKQSGHEGEAAAILKGNPIPSTNVAASFESYYFPQFLEWRGDHATYLKLRPAGTAEPPK